MSREFTLGVEEEFQIIDPETRTLQCHIAELISATTELDELAIMPELHESVVEVATGICDDIKDARRQVVSNRRKLSSLAERVGLRIAAASTHPFAAWQDQRTTASARYEKLVDDLQEVARGNLIFGLHVHVGIPDRDEAIAIYNSARYFLPHLLALTTSSPFWEGRNTGLRSMRSLLFERMPRTGIPSRFDDYAQFVQFVETLVHTGCIDNGSKIWWDLRPHASHDTLEFRVCDIPTRVDHVIPIVALVQALVVKLARIHRSNMTWNAYRTDLIAENKWRALRYGLNGRLIDLGRRVEVPVAQLVDEFIDLVDDVLDDLDSRDEVERIRRIVAEGTSADRQLRVWEASDGDLKAVVDDLMDQTLVGVV